MTAYCNVLECTKTHRAVHSTWFDKTFPKLPCNTLQEIEAVNTVLGTISSSVHAVNIFIIMYSIMCIYVGESGAKWLWGKTHKLILCVTQLH
jgi:hypothetical protein